MISEVKCDTAIQNKRKGNVYLWIGLNLKKDIETKLIFSDVYGRYLRVCRTQRTISCSKKKVPVYIKEFFMEELNNETITMEN